MRIALAGCERPTEHDSDADFLGPALRRRGAEVDVPAWSEGGVDWSGYDLVCINSTWDYHLRVEEFRSWLRGVDAVSRLRNPLETVLWNLDKRYLRELEEAGVPTIPTIWTEPGAEQQALAEIERRGWAELVIKPAIDLGAEQLARAGASDADRVLAALREPALVQPFLGSLTSVGEISLLFVDGRPLHAIRKRPARGDFRVQPQYGGTHEAITPPAELVEIGERAIAAAAGEPLYARVDLVFLPGPDGASPALIELELIEPHFYLDAAPAGAEEIARALLAAANA